MRSFPVFSRWCGRCTKSIRNTNGDVNGNDLIFPELKRLDNLDDRFITEKAIGFATSRIDKCLNKEVALKAGINKTLTMHIAHHSFGNISGDKIPIQMLQKLYRHSSITTTIGYQSNFIHKDAVDALDAVLNFSKVKETYIPT